MSRTLRTKKSYIVFTLLCLSFYAKAGPPPDSRRPEIMPIHSHAVRQSQPVEQDASPEPDEGKKLAQILKSTADYCEKLEHISIYYYCRERVKEIIYPLPLRYRGIMNRVIGIHGQIYKFRNQPSIINDYTYDYQLIRKRNKKVKEKRRLLEKNGRKKQNKNISLQTKCFRFSEIVYGPLVFSKSEQPFYRFEILRKEKQGQKDVLVIKVSPRPDVQKELFYGEFWVDEKDFSILKIKMSQQALGDYYKILKTATLINAEPRITIVMDYDTEKNGIRFPARFSLEEAYITPKDETIILSELHVLYDEYRFFNVDVDVKISSGN